MTYTKLMINTAAAALLLSATAAMSNQVQCPDGSWVNPGTSCTITPPPNVDPTNSVEVNNWLKATYGDQWQVANSVSNATGGSVGNIDNSATGGKGGKGGSVGNVNSTSSADGGKVTNSGNSKNANQNVNNNRTGNQITNVDASNHSRQAASSAATAVLPNTGVANCFGDTNPSGSFSASIQTFGWGVAAARSKASNICAVAALAGPGAAIGYLQKVDRNVPRSIVVMQPTGRTVCPASHPILTSKGCKK